MNRCILNNTRIWTFVSIMVIMVLMPWTPVFAQGSTHEHLAAILILDNSGSMTTSDPTDLRYTAAQLFVALLDQGDAVGALRFSTTSHPITNGIEIIENSEQQSQLVESLAAVSPEGFTDIKAVFEQAQQMVQGFDQTGYKSVVIFLTDGRPEIENKYATYDQEAIDAAISLNIPILSIALTDSGQSPFLNRVATETGGQVIFANEAADLLDIYLQILGDLKDRTVLGNDTVSVPGEALLPLDQALMPYVDQVSFVVSKPSSVSDSLVAPDGQTISASDPKVAFAIQDQRFSVYTIPQPVGGDWHFVLNGSGSVQARAILYSRLRVRLVSPPGIFEAGTPVPIVVKLVEEQPGQAPVNIIGQASFSALIIRPDGTKDSLDQFYDDGSHADALAGDGLFTREYVNTDQAGNYQINIQGFKGSVPVVYHTQIQGITFPQPVLDQPILPRYDIRTNTVPLQIHLTGATVNELDKGSFIAKVITPSGMVERITLVYVNNTYTGEYSPTEDGTYQISFEPLDATFQGLPYLHKVGTTFDARIIPSLSVLSVQVGLSQPTGKTIPRFELVQARQGVPIIITIKSTSPRTEYIMAKLENLAGFTLMEENKFAIAARGNSTLTMHIIADPTLTAQTVEGRLVFTIAEGVDLVDGEVPLEFDLFEPTLSVVPVITSTVSPKSCLHWAPVKLILFLSSSSIQNEQINIHLENLPGISLSQETIPVQPGISQVELTLLPAKNAFESGKYAGQLVIEGVALQGSGWMGNPIFQSRFK